MASPEAIAAEEARLRQLLATMGPDHESIGDTFFALGDCCVASGKLSEALVAYQGAESTFERSKPEQPAFVGISLARQAAVQVCTHCMKEWWQQDKPVGG